MKRGEREIRERGEERETNGCVGVLLGLGTFGSTGFSFFRHLIERKRKRESVSIMEVC